MEQFEIQLDQADRSQAELVKGCKAWLSEKQHSSGAAAAQTGIAQRWGITCLLSSASKHTHIIYVPYHICHGIMR